MAFALRNQAFALQNQRFALRKPKLPGLFPETPDRENRNFSQRHEPGFPFFQGRRNLLPKSVGKPGTHDREGNRKANLLGNHSDFFITILKNFQCGLAHQMRIGNNMRDFQSRDVGKSLQRGDYLIGRKKPRTERIHDAKNDYLSAGGKVREACKGTQSDFTAAHITNDRNIGTIESRPDPCGQSRQITVLDTFIRGDHLNAGLFEIFTNLPNPKKGVMLVFYSQLLKTLIS